VKNWKQVLLLIACLALVLVAVVGCGGDGEDEGAGEEEVKKVSVGSKEFTEQLILGQLAVVALEDAGFEVEDNTGLGGTDVVRGALESGDVDLYWEYTGTAWITHLGHDNAITDPQECYDSVKEEDAGNGLVWLDYAPLNNTYTIMLRKDMAEDLGIETISDLAEYMNQEEREEIVFATDHEFSVRDDGLPALCEVYGFEFDDVVTMDMGITYEALKNDEVQSAMGFATDARIQAFDLVNLVDDKQFFPVYNAAVVVREDTLNEYPEIEDIFGPISELLDDATMASLNAKVDIDGMEPKEVAQEFLEENGLLQ